MATNESRVFFEAEHMFKGTKHKKNEATDIREYRARSAFASANPEGDATAIEFLRMLSDRGSMAKISVNSFMTNDSFNVMCNLASFFKGETTGKLHVSFGRMLWVGYEEDVTLELRTEEGLTRIVFGVGTGWSLKDTCMVAQAITAYAIRKIATSFDIVEEYEAEKVDPSIGLVFSEYPLQKLEEYVFSHREIMADEMIAEDFLSDSREYAAVVMGRNKKNGKTKIKIQTGGARTMSVFGCEPFKFPVFEVDIEVN